MFLWRQVPPLMTFCGQWETTWQRLTQISQAGVDNCTLLKLPNMKCACLCVCLGMLVCTYRWYIVWGLTLIQRISQCWIRGHLLFAAESCWTTVSYVNWPFVQCAKWNQHIQGCTYRARTDKMQLFTLPSKQFIQQGWVKGISTDKDR